MSSEEYRTASRRRQLPYGARAGEREVRGAGGEKSDEPRVVVERLQRRNEEAAPRQRAAERRRRDRTQVPAAVDAVRQIQILELQFAAAHQPVVSDEDAGNRSESAGVSEQPGVDVAGGIGEELPRLYRDAEQSGDQASGL